MNISAEFTKLPGVFGASSKYGWHIHSTVTTWEYVRNADSWAHPRPTESESPGGGHSSLCFNKFSRYPEKPWSKWNYEITYYWFALISRIKFQ